MSWADGTFSSKHLQRITTTSSEVETLRENIPLKEPKVFERETLRYFEGQGKVTFTKHFLMMGKVTSDEHV